MLGTDASDHAAVDPAAFYEEHGWYATDTVLPPKMVDRARATIEAIESHERDGEIPERLGEFLAWPPGEPRPVRLNQYIAFQYEALADLVFHPRVAEIAARLTNSPTVRLFNSALIAKQPGQDARYANVGWHCDRAYWPTCSSDRMLTAWIPLQDTSETTGTLTVLDRSHSWPRGPAVEELRRAQEFSTDSPGGLRQRLDSVGEEVDPIPIQLKRGQLSFHHALTFHGSGVNTGDRPRLAISVHLQDASNRYVGAGDEGADYVHDRFVRRRPSGEPDYADPEICPVLWPRG